MFIPVHNLIPISSDASTMPHYSSSFKTKQTTQNFQKDIEYLQKSWNKQQKHFQ